MTENFKLNIFFTLDTICPFTYLGRRKLQLAIRLAKDENLPIDFNVQYRPYDIAKKLSSKTAVSKREFYLDRNGGNDEQLEKMIAAMTQMGKEVGINFSYGGSIMNTLAAHRVIYKVQTEKLGNVEALMDSLYKQYFELEQPPATLPTLLKACEAAGVKDLEGMENFIGSDAYEEEVKESIMEQNINNSEGVPYVEFEGDRRDFTLVGAKEPIEYLNTMKQVLKERR